VKYKHLKQALLFKVDSLMKFRMWFKYGLKAQKLQKQHALNQRSPAEGKGKGQKLQKQHALKGQKLLAQGIALGIMAISKAPCKGKSFVYCQVFESFCPYRATGLRP
jgi:hypothetical protein